LRHDQLAVDDGSEEKPDHYFLIVACSPSGTNQISAGIRRPAAGLGECGLDLIAGALQNEGLSPRSRLVLVDQAATRMRVKA